MWIRFSTFPHKSFYPGRDLLPKLIGQDLSGKIPITTFSLWPMVSNLFDVFSLIWPECLGIYTRSLWLTLFLLRTAFLLHNCNLPSITDLLTQAQGYTSLDHLDDCKLLQWEWHTPSTDNPVYIWIHQSWWLKCFVASQK